MNKIILIFLIKAVCGINHLFAQDLQIFEIKYIEKDSNQSFAFISLSEIYSFSENPDSLAIPALTEKQIDEAPNFTYFKLESKYRQRFLSATNISETDQVFVYDYSINDLQKFTVKDLNIVACLNPYGADWPYSQEDFMLGIELNINLFKNSNQYFTNSLAYIGKESPFIQGKVKPIIWKKIDPEDYPSKELPSYDTSYAGTCIKGEVYKFENESEQYFIQDLVNLANKWVSAKHLIIVDNKTKKIIFEKIFYSGESASFAPLDNQWTGKLFKNKPSVIFGFHWVSFGCPRITFLNPEEKDIYIFCDNRH